MKPKQQRLELLQLVLDCLNALRLRATYMSLAPLLEVAGGQQVGAILLRCPRDFRHSWIVSRRNKRPTGYLPSQWHSQLFESPRVIDDALTLANLVIAWLEQQLATM